MGKFNWDEHFVVIEEYPNYMVSNYGRVVNHKFDRDLTPVIHVPSGMMKVRLYDGHNNSEFFWVHRLVAKAFFVNYDEDREVNFVNPDNPTDCSVTNLTIGLQEKKRKTRER